MITMKDIARLAGVSHGTVSNVINKKGVVSVDKIRLVENAAKQLGYNMNAPAQQLRKDHLQYVAIILPNITLDGFRDFYNTLDALLKYEGYDTGLFLSENIVAKEKECIQNALSSRPEFIIAFSCFSDPTELYNINTNVILINHPLVQPLNRQRVFSFDFRAAADAIATKLHSMKYHNVAIFADSASIPADRFFIDALNISEAARDIVFTVFSYDIQLAHNGAIEILTSEPGFDAVITSDCFRADKLNNIQTLIDRPCPFIISLSSKQIMPSYSWMKLELDFREMAHLIFESITKPSLSNNTINTIPVSGFSGQSMLIPKKHSGEITLVTLKSPTSEVLKVLAPHFFKCTGVQIKIIALPYNELYEMISTSNLKRFDLIRMDMAWQSILEKGFCLPLHSLGNQLDEVINSLLPSIRTTYLQQQDNIYTLPFDPSVQLMFYRKDLFEDAKIRRQYYEANHQQLEIPTTFQDYNKVAAFFSRRSNPASPTLYGSTITYGSSVVAACDFLPRFKSMGGNIFDGNGRINITTQKAIKALQDYSEIRDYANPDVHFWWNDSMESFANGSTAMTIVFDNYASRVINSRRSVIFDKVGTAKIPGNMPLLGGGIIGISNQSQKIDQCICFLKWIYSDEIANLLVLLGGHSACASVFKNEEILTLYPWLRNIDKHFQVGSRHNNNPRYPNFDGVRFEQILGLAVRNAAMGIMSPEEALKSAQDQYDTEFSL